MLALFDRDLDSGDRARMQKARSELSKALDTLEQFYQDGFFPTEDPNEGDNDGGE